MKVLVCDKFEETGLAALRNISCDVAYHPESKSEEDLIRLIESVKPSVLIVRSSKVTAPMLKTGAIQLIVRAGAGVNTIDVKSCSELGVYVSNCPGKNSIAVAELVFGLIISLDRRIVENTISLKEGTWNKKEYSKARGLHGRNLGVIGLGNIGMEVITRAKGFGINIVAWSRSLTPEKAEELDIKKADTLLDLANKSDIVTLHVPYKKETESLLKKDFFEALRSQTILVNTSRAEIIDRIALDWAIQAKSLRFGSDVYYNEPSESTASFMDPFILKGAYGTHHIGASTDQAQEAIAAETVHIIETFKSTGKVPNAVNLATPTIATHCLTVRHRDRPGVLATVLTALRTEKINVQEMENNIFEGAEAAIARINLDSPPSPQLLAQMRNCSPEILDISLFQLR